MKSKRVHIPPTFHASKNGTRRILSVDDETGILFTRRALLENAGYTVLSAADGEQALQLFAGEAVDIVLLDYVMPGMNGGTVAQKMKIAKPLVPVIIVSASPVEEELLAYVDCLVSKGEGPACSWRRLSSYLRSSQLRKRQTQKARLLTACAPDGEHRVSRICFLAEHPIAVAHSWKAI